jgi:hypothetical protein
MREPLAEFTLTIRTRSSQRGRKKLRVFIWKHVKDLRIAAKKSSERSAHYWKHAAGAYVGRRDTRQFGEIHLWEKFMGAGYWAHELQHFMMDYFLGTETFPIDNEANERMAHLAGELTAEFWTKFYERFEVQSG